MEEIQKCLKKVKKPFILNDTKTVVKYNIPQISDLKKKIWSDRRATLRDRIYVGIHF